MTKEEILKNALGGVYGISEEVFKQEWKKELQAMDQFAKEVAIGFKKWSDSFYIETGCDTDGYIYYSHVSGESDEKFTEEQLFQSYLQSLK